MAEIPKTLGRYVIAERVGRGGMGALYRGTDPVLDREVAIKVMHADFSGDENARPRFFREARAAAKLQHRNIVTIFEFDEEDGVPYIVMEFLRGRNLSARMSAPPALALEEKLDIVDQLCTGLSFAHLQGVVHRDVKPANVWVQDDGTVKLLDFGIAKVSSSTMTIGSDIMGSAPYMAPEQVEGQQVDGRADIFSAGAILYELLSGRRPFLGDSATAVMMQIIGSEPSPISQLVPDLPAPLVAAVGRALQKSPDKRYASAQLFAADLRQIRRSLQVSSDLDSGSFGESRAAKTVLLPGPSTQSPGAQGGHPADLSVTQYEPAIEADVAGSASQAPPQTKRLAVIVAVVALVVLATAAGLWLTKGRPEVESASSAPAAVQSPPTVQATPPTPPEGTARQVQLTSEPSGAEITQDGRKIGVTPATVEIAAGAPARYRLTMRNYATLNVTVSPEQAAVGAANYQLKPTDNRVVTLRATGDYEFEVREDQKILSAAATQHEIRLSGIHTVRLVAPSHYLNQSVRLDPNDGARREVPVPVLGRLQIRIRGGVTCRIRLNGRDERRSDLDIVPGTYEVTADCGDGKQESQSVTITDTTTTVRFPKG